jgi:hypothetical protein
VPAVLGVFCPLMTAERPSDDHLFLASSDALHIRVISHHVFASLASGWLGVSRCLALG